MGQLLRPGGTYLVRHRWNLVATFRCFPVVTSSRVGSMAAPSVTGSDASPFMSPRKTSVTTPCQPPLPESPPVLPRRLGPGIPSP